MYVSAGSCLMDYVKIRKYATTKECRCCSLVVGKMPLIHHGARGQPDGISSDDKHVPIQK